MLLRSFLKPRRSQYFCCLTIAVSLFKWMRQPSILTGVFRTVVHLTVPNSININQTQLICCAMAPVVQLKSNPKVAKLSEKIRKSELLLVEANHVTSTLKISRKVELSYVRPDQEDLVRCRGNMRERVPLALRQHQYLSKCIVLQRLRCEINLRILICQKIVI